MFVAASDLLQDSDSSTESSIQNSKQAARLSRRLKKYKNQKRYGAAHIFNNIVADIGVYSLAFHIYTILIYFRSYCIGIHFASIVCDWRHCTM